jgi:hypothetical protein
VHSYGAPVHSAKLKAVGLDPVFNWKACDLAGNCPQPVLAEVWRMVVEEFLSLTNLPPQFLNLHEMGVGIQKK